MDGSGDYFTGRRALENLYLDDEETASTTDTDESSIDTSVGSSSGNDSDSERSTDTENSGISIQDGEENN